MEGRTSTSYDTYVTECERLFAAGAYAAVRDTAQRGLAEAEETGHEERTGAIAAVAALHCRLGRAHAAEDDEDHDAEAERAYRAGLSLAPDDLDLLAAYAELCIAADSFGHPGRAAHAPKLLARIEELAPTSSQAARAREADRRDKRGYRETLKDDMAEAQIRNMATAEQQKDTRDALAARGTRHAARGTRHAARGTRHAETGRGRRRKRTRLGHERGSSPRPGPPTTTPRYSPPRLRSFPVRARACCASSSGTARWPGA
ncbi:hypothetical protein [Streptomyces sp. NPDC003077]|uniref:hypothetical protein n=1 Tax=Streptomyces sp. NPDC003077 TaxID=3154443 RepID=UPI0033AA65F6